MGQLEPCAGEGVRELIGVLVEAPRDFLVGRVEPQRQVRREHGRNVLFRRIMRVRDRGFGVFGLPLLRTRRALRQFPFEAEQVVEEEIAPFRRRLGPGHFRAAGNGVSAKTCAELALPAETLIFQRPGFGLRADERRIARAVRLAERVTARDQRDGFFVVHGHAEEGLTNVLRSGDRVRIAVRAFRIDIDEAHLHRAERLRELALAAVALVAEPGAFRTPEQFFRFPHVGAAAGETERLEAHRLERDVAREDHEIRP